MSFPTLTYNSIQGISAINFGPLNGEFHLVQRKAAEGIPHLHHPFQMNLRSIPATWYRALLLYHTDLEN